MRAVDPLGCRSGDLSTPLGNQPLGPTEPRGAKAPAQPRRQTAWRRDKGDACAEEPASHPPGPSTRKGNNTPSERQAG